MMWTFPQYNLDTLQARARARLVAMGENPRDRLRVYHLVAKLRAEELRASRSQGNPQGPQAPEGTAGSSHEGHYPGDAVGMKPIPVAKSARIGSS